MGQTPPPAPPGGRKTGASQGPSISEDYGDYNDFESDATNVNQIPQPGQTPIPHVARPSQPPQMFPQGSPQLSHMGQTQPPPMQVPNVAPQTNMMASPLNPHNPVTHMGP